MLMHEICHINALRNPRGEALVGEWGERETWSELRHSVDATANMLAAAGVRKGDRVCCLAKNCLEAIHLFFAASELGALYAPVNYRFAIPEINQLLADSRPTVFVASSEYAETVRSLQESGTADFVTAWLIIGSDDPRDTSFEQMVKAAPSRDYYPEIQETDPSWICYTGGTTSRPKGAVLTHRAMTAGAVNFIITCQIRPEDVYYVAGALFHIALAVPIAFWMAGAKVVLGNFEPERSLRAISQEGVTQMVCTGTIFKMLVDEMTARPQPTKLRLIYCGGAPVSPQLVQRAESVFDCGVCQIYGQTEVTLMATFLYPEEYRKGFEAAEGTPERRRLNSVGRAAPLCAIHIVGNTLDQLPPGQVGEIVVYGPNVMAEYANMPDLTRETLQSGWIRTGDLGYMDEDGYVFLVDRKKDMIITGGENVYSSEVELVLCQHPAISEAVVIGVPDDHWGEAVLALVVPKPEQQTDPEELRAFCRAHLAGYKVPKRIEFHEPFPRLPTGKIAKGKLRDPYWAGRDRRI